ncbi:SipW-dependent-type signal peptide-containing protein [Gemmiger sp.]|uniref:SipW-dependent-type signal peptide-containing protein n=1 Tax=Gemmiger sp. TaxID=2049027 RepID=UPI003A8F81E4
MRDNRTSVKRSLFVSAIALALTAALLIGTTFAWFTSTASTGVNKIQAGNLDVKLLAEDGVTSLEGVTLEWQKAAGAEDEDILWEPGCRYLTKGFRVANKGNLALKWKAQVNKGTTAANEGNFNLLDVIDFYLVKGTGESQTETPLNEFTGNLKKTETSDVYYIKGVMQTNADNDYQGLTLDGITITVYATQDTVENDSFNDQYDKDATYPVVVSKNELNTSLTLDALKDENGKVSPVEVTLGDTSAEDINYSQNNSGYTGKGVMLGSTNLNKYAATPAAAGEYKFTFKDGTITSEAKGYGSIDDYKNTSVYMLVPGNSDVVFENMTFNGVVSFDIQKYTSPWSNLNSISFKNCTFNGIIIGTCPASNVTFDGCTFNAYTNTASANNSNPIWWREDTEGSGTNANPIETFTFVNNKVTGTRPVKIERIGKTVSPIFTIKNNSFDISKQAGDTATKNMAINIGMGEKPNLPFTLIDEGNTISANTAALYTASLTGGSNQYKETSGMKVLDGNGNNKVITALVWKTTTGETFELKTVG